MKSVSVRSCKTYNYEEVRLSIEKKFRGYWWYRQVC